MRISRKKFRTFFAIFVSRPMCKWRILEIIYNLNPSNKPPDLFSRETSQI